MTVALTAVAAFMLDWLLGEPRRCHPLVGFGRLSAWLEQRCYGGPTTAPRQRRLRGAAALAVAAIPIAAAAAVLAALPTVGIVFSTLALYLAIGHRSLHDHARPVVCALRRSDDERARRIASRMVSRDPEALDAACATTESVLENGNDGVFGALFWFLVAGAAGSTLYRLVNTLDAMWGYRNAHYRDFGWAAARLDDTLNYVPARLTALTYAILGNTLSALRCWRRQASAWDSPNAGPVMAAGAGALTVSIGGPARYAGEWHRRPTLGSGSAPRVHDIERALRLVRNGVWLWLTLLILSAGFYRA